MTKPTTEAARFQDAMRTIMSVPKKEIDRREADWKKSQDEKKKKVNLSDDLKAPLFVLPAMVAVAAANPTYWHSLFWTVRNLLQFALGDSLPECSFSTGELRLLLSRQENFLGHSDLSYCEWPVATSPRSRSDFCAGF